MQGGHPQQQQQQQQHDQEPFLQGGGPQGQGGGSLQGQGGGYPPPGAGVGGFNQKPIQTTTSMNIVFFGAGAAISLGAFIGIFALLAGGNLIDCLQNIYFLVFGVGLMIYDTPFFKTVKMIEEYRLYVGKYASIVSRVTGKGVIFLFLGNALLAILWSNMDSGFFAFIGIVACLYVIVVGVGAVAIGVKKSQRLRSAQQQLAHDVLETNFARYAQTYRPENSGPNGGFTGGLTPQEFGSLTRENGSIVFDEADLKLIFNALVSNPTWRTGAPEVGKEPHVTLQDLQVWVRGGPVFL